MFPLFESIRCYNGRIYNIEAHNRRVNMARQRHFGLSKSLNLRKYIDVPVECRKGLFKCRIAYGVEIDKPIFSKYAPKQITSLKLIESSICYDYKWEDRQELTELFANRGPYDDILIVKNGLLSDTSYANVALYNGSGWFTPKAPLLKGTMRNKLLIQKRIHEREIRVDNIKDCQKISLINALNPLGRMVLDCNQIY